MKSPYFTIEHEVFRDGVRKFMEEEVAPNADQWERDRMVPREIWRRMGELGYLGIHHEEAWGGSEADFFYSVVFLEELQRSNMGGFSAAVSVQEYMATAHLAKAGSDGLKKAWLEPAIAGGKIGAIAISEPDVGSDVANLRTRAVRDGDHYVINGAKMFITNGFYADFAVVACRTNPDPEAGAAGISLILVDTTTPGFRARKLDKIGWHCSDTAEMSFEDVRVPVTNLIGLENQGFYYIMESFQLERLVAAVASVGGAQLCLDRTIDYIQNRKAFNRPVARFQTIRHEIAELATELEATRQLVYHTAWLYDQGEMAVRECSMAKLKATEVANHVIDRCLQCFGGYGYMEEYPIARAYRDARVGTIAGGTSAIMREIIAKIELDDTRYNSAYAATPTKKSGDEAPPAPKPASAETPAAAEQPIAQTQVATDPVTLNALFLALPDRFKEDRAGAWRSVIHFDIGGDGGGRFTLSVEDGTASVREGLHGEAKCIVETEADTFLDMESGKIAPEMAFMSGQLRVSNIPEMMTFMKAFHRG
ncbi:Acyl-CoA dehydrogenase family protein [Sulfidibacter corallicola]|uniref:Acyl-CoA dehydrogenase family protein n=1 Tax=Sulfidibacter corallicola TaxID=2818388 RepID=A0A8A4TK61_SULCO|nr:acyl-CoA dehydrogenase family protein [Sulfidibacter corallicola]QTD50326.1 acyl-CoA dehydrogenase family protein [Sulfidibacter corallicola]